MDRRSSPDPARRISGPWRGAAIAGLAERVSERIIPAAQVFQPLLDDIYEVSAAMPTPLDARRRRLAPEAVVALDWHNDMSKLVLDINDRIEAPPTTARAASSSGDCGGRSRNSVSSEACPLEIGGYCVEKRASELEVKASA